MSGSRSNTVRLPSGSERVVMTPAGLLSTTHSAARGAATGRLSTVTLSRDTSTICPVCATSPLTRTRPAESFAAPNDVDQSALVQSLEDAANVDTANLLDLGSADRLTIGNDGERLERGRG